MTQDEIRNEIKEAIKNNLRLDLTEDSLSYSSARRLRVKLIWQGPTNSSFDPERFVISEDYIDLPGGD